MYVCMYVTFARACVRVSVGACVRVCVCVRLSQTQKLPFGNKNLEVRTEKSELGSRNLEVGSRN